MGLSDDDVSLWSCTLRNLLTQQPEIFRCKILIEQHVIYDVAITPKHTATCQGGWLTQTVLAGVSTLYKTSPKDNSALKSGGGSGRQT